MSHSDSDSEGFESADDNEFDETKKLNVEDKSKSDEKPRCDEQSKCNDKPKSDEKSKSEKDQKSLNKQRTGKGTKSEENPKIVQKPVPEPEQSTESKPLEVKNADPPKISESKLEPSTDNDFDDNWEWGDDEENAIEDTNKQDSKVKPAESMKATIEKAEAGTTKQVNEKQILDNLSGAQASKSSWAPWSGVVSFLSTATDGVASFTSHVSSVIESNIGIPDPTVIAQQQRLEKEKGADKAASDSFDETNNKERDESSLSLGSFVSNVTQISNRVISGGLDTLEGIGKKTMNILQENDPGLVNKRKLLGLDSSKPVLSQILREAKEKSEEAEKNMKIMQKKTYKKTLHFESLFDDYHGLVHLEALEMLSKQATIRLQSLLMPLTGKALTELNDTLNEVKELCELNELEQEDPTDYESSELEEKLKASFEDLDIPIDFSDILEAWSENSKWLTENINKEDESIPQKIYDRALQCLAKTSALSVNKYHKLAELLLIKEHHNTANEADSLVQITNTLCWHLSGIANRFGGHLSNDFSNSTEVDTNSLITSIFLEGSKSTSYIQNAFQLFIPILQIGAV